jgi:hypothetical protein
MEEEILLLNQNQPTFEQMIQLFLTQEASFERIRIHLFDETTIIHNELKEIREMKGRKFNIDPQLNKMKTALLRR